MPPNERADLSAGPIAVVHNNSSTRDERFVMVPLRIRREHRDWSDDEHAVWLDLFLASYELGGRFESRAMMEAVIGSGRDQTGNTIADLIERGAIVEDGDDFILLDYAEQYDGRVPRGRKSLVERLADAEAKIAAGEPLNNAERWARWRARQDGAELPDPRRETKEERGKTQEGRLKTEPTLEPTLANEPTPIVPRLGNLYEAFSQLTGLPCTKADESRIDNLCGQFDRDQVRRAMYADPNPRLNPEKLLGRVYHGLKGAAA